MLHQWYVDGEKITKASCSDNKTEIKWKTKKTSTRYKHLLLWAVAVLSVGNLSNGRFRGDGDLDRKLSHDPCITAHDLANFPAVAGTSTT